MKNFTIDGQTFPENKTRVNEYKKNEPIQMDEQFIEDI